VNSPAPQLRSRLPRLAEAAVERARLTVVPRRRTRAPRVPFVTLVSVVLLGGVIGLLLFNTSMQQASFAATALEEQATNLSAREQTLQMELERLRDPQRVAEAARRQGLVDPPPPAFLDLDTGEVTGDPTPATRANTTPIAPPPPPRPAELDPPPVEQQRERAGDDERGNDRGQGRDRDGGQRRDGEPRR
jgi:cell division protein FtsB